MGLVIVSGLGIGTVFTLFVVPAYYLFIARDHRARADEGAAAPRIPPDPEAEGPPSRA
jgi:multidrug efflux pump